MDTLCAHDPPLGLDFIYLDSCFVQDFIQCSKNKGQDSNMGCPRLFSKNHNFYIFITWGYCIAIGHLYTSECDNYWSSRTMQCMTILAFQYKLKIRHHEFDRIILYWPTLMALFQIDALLANDLFQQIIKVDEVVLYLKVGNPICQECITAEQ